MSRTHRKFFIALSLVAASVIAAGGSGVVIASQSGHRLPPLSVEQNNALATTPVEELLRLPFLQLDKVTDSLHAYQLANRSAAERQSSATQSPVGNQVPRGLARLVTQPSERCTPP